AGDDAEQRRGGNDAGRADSDSDRRQQHRDGQLQGCRADVEGDAADHRRQHRDHADRAGERLAGLQPRRQQHSADQHPARDHAGARQRRTDDGDRRHFREPGAGPDRPHAGPGSDSAAQVAVQARHGERPEHRTAGVHHAADHQELTQEMKGMRIVIHLAGLVFAAAAATSCGDAVRQGSSPVYLVIDSLQGIRGGATAGRPSSSLISDVVTNVTQPPPCSTEKPCPTIFADAGSVTLRAPLKDIGNGTLAPTTNNEITITQYHVEYIRADGRNVQGVDVPYAFDGGVTGTVPAGGTLTLGFTLVRNVAKQEAPLADLRTGSNTISTVARVTFYGSDRVGNNVNVTGQIDVVFGNFGDQ